MSQLFRARRDCDVILARWELFANNKAERLLRGWEPPDAAGIAAE